MMELHAPLILVVEDHRDAREMYAEYLRICGFRVAEARDGREAVAQATALLPDVILMDLSLPGMDGREATRVIKSSPLTRGIPVVALTGHTAPSSYGVTEDGYAAFITKPCLPDDLVAHIRRLLAT